MSPREHLLASAINDRVTGFTVPGELLEASGMNGCIGRVGANTARPAFLLNPASTGPTAFLTINQLRAVDLRPVGITGLNSLQPSRMNGGVLRLLSVDAHC